MPYTVNMLNGVTYNVFLGRTLEPLLTWLYEENDPLDLYCFQEFPEHRIADFKERLESRGYMFCFAPGFTWRGITYGELTAFKRGRLELLQTKTLSLGGKGEPNLVFIREGMKFDVRIARIQINKSALVTTFRCGEHRFTLVNAHLSADIHNGRKLKQLRLILDNAAGDERAIILGDFNYAIGRELSKLMRQNGFTSAIKRQSTFRFAPGIYWQNDYIFERGCTIENVIVKRVGHSDHYPVFFSLAL